MKPHIVQAVQFAVVVANALLISACPGGNSGGPNPLTYTVGGSVSGLQGSGLVLQDNLGDDLSPANNGSFVFASAIAIGGAYSVTVKTQPTNVWQICAVTSGTGNVGAGNVTKVAVTCVTNTYAVGGAVSGLAGAGLLLENNAADDLSVSSSAVSVM